MTTWRSRPVHSAIDLRSLPATLLFDNSEPAPTDGHERPKYSDRSLESRRRAAREWIDADRIINARDVLRAGCEFRETTVTHEPLPFLWYVWGTQRRAQIP